MQGSDTLDPKDLSAAYRLNTKMRAFYENSSKRFNSFSATQIGIPSDAIYYHSQNVRNSNELFLIKPHIKILCPTNAYVLKLVDCPSSPFSKVLAIFHTDILITSANTKDIKMAPFEEVISTTGRFDISADIQKAIWASKGVLPGDPTSAIINYCNIAGLLETTPDLKNKFECVVHQEEIEKIMSELLFLPNMYLPKRALLTFKNNIAKLAAEYHDRTWVPIPAENLFREDIKPLLMN